ncbi:unnamed protein product [Protopolystoma xenopodis]|uniref:Uncharacterized protein n=1 Tax=Protopolystoma xenopodis TaxID=117903 RepID=A0A3S5CT74_9PLAT|nr:unnamed protein product [Protopolystoma xenopodis]
MSQAQLLPAAFSTGHLNRATASLPRPLQSVFGPAARPEEDSMAPSMPSLTGGLITMPASIALPSRSLPATSLFASRRYPSPSRPSVSVALSSGLASPPHHPNRPVGGPRLVPTAASPARALFFSQSSAGERHVDESSCLRRAAGLARQRDERRPTRQPDGLAVGPSVSPGLGLCTRPRPGHGNGLARMSTSSLTAAGRSSGLTPQTGKLRISASASTSPNTGSSRRLLQSLHAGSASSGLGHYSGPACTACTASAPNSSSTSAGNTTTTMTATTTTSTTSALRHPTRSNSSCLSPARSALLHPGNTASHTNTTVGHHRSSGPTDAPGTNGLMADFLECARCPASRRASLDHWVDHLGEYHPVPASWPSARADHLSARERVTPYTSVVDSHKKRKPNTVPRPLNSFMVSLDVAWAAHTHTHATRIDTSAQGAVVAPKSVIISPITHLNH